MVFYSANGDLSSLQIVAGKLKILRYGDKDYLNALDWTELQSRNQFNHLTY
jgi:hypothetical protein